MEWNVGTLVRPREDAGTKGHTVGLVMAIRRRRVQVWFPEKNEAPWLPMDALQQLIPRGDVRDHPWALVSWIIQAVQSTEFEWQHSRPFRLTTKVAELNRARFEEVSQFLGDLLKDWVIRPAGMSGFWIDWFITLPEH